MIRMVRHSIILALCLLLCLPVSICPVHSEERPVAYLSLSDTLKIAIFKNLDIRLANIDNWIESTELLYSQAIFDTTLTGEFTYTDDQRETASAIAGTGNRTNIYKAELEKKLPTGATFSTAYSDTREWTNSSYVTQNPSHTAEWSLSISQPVLRNFMGMQDWGGIVMSRINVKNSDINTLDRIEASLASVEKLYWELVFAYRKVGIEKEMLKRAQELLDINKRHLKTGVVEKGDLLGSEANVRIRENGLLIAENNLTDAINQLKLALDEGDDLVIIEPLDELDLREEEVSFPASLKYAFNSRRDYKIKKNDLRRKKINLVLKENDLWPEVDLVGTLAMNGVDSKLDKAAGTTTTGKFPKYYAGIKVSMSLDNNEARSKQEKAKYEKIKTITELQKLERSIITQIDEKVRDVLTQHERAKKSIAIKKLQELKLDEEEKRYRYGRSSGKTLIDYQNDLISAELDEARAIRDYKIAMVELERAENKLLEKVGLITQ